MVSWNQGESFNRQEIAKGSNTECITFKRQNCHLGTWSKGNDRGIRDHHPSG